MDIVTEALGEGAGGPVGHPAKMPYARHANHPSPLLLMLINRP